METLNAAGMDNEPIMVKVHDEILQTHRTRVGLYESSL